MTPVSKKEHDMVMASGYVAMRRHASTAPSGNGVPFCVVSLRNQNTYATFFPNEKISKMGMRKIVVEGSQAGFRFRKAQPGEFGYSLRKSKSQRDRYEFPLGAIGRITCEDGMTRRQVEEPVERDGWIYVSWPSVWTVQP